MNQNYTKESIALLLDRFRCRVTLAGRQEMRAGWSLPERTLPVHDLIRVYEGRGVFICGGRELKVSAPAWVVLPAHVPHSIHGSGLRLGVVHVDWGAVSHFDALTLFFPEMEIAPALPPGIEELFEKSIDSWLERTAVGRVCANRWIELWFVKAVGERKPAGVDSRIVDAIAWIHRNADRVFPLEELAKAVGLSAARLRALFRRDMGVSPKRMIQEIKLQRAQTLLSEGGVGVAEAAYRAGWEDVSAFSKSFRRRFGISPGNFRRTASQLAVV